MKKENNTEELLEEAYTIMAEVIRDYGEKYLPIFKRLHEERELRQANRKLTDIALMVAQKTP